MRRVDCRRCQEVVVEEVPWADGKRTLTKACMLFLASWARRLSWKETAEAFHTSWDKVFDAVEQVVSWGLEHRVLGQIDAIGVDEIQYAKGHCPTFGSKRRGKAVDLPSDACAVRQNANSAGASLQVVIKWTIRQISLKL